MKNTNPLPAIVWRGAVRADSSFAARALCDLVYARGEYLAHGARLERDGSPCAAPSDSVPGMVARLDRAIARLQAGAPVSEPDGYYVAPFTL